MKKYLLFFSVCFLALLVSCRKDDFGDGSSSLKPVPFMVKVRYGEGKDAPSDAVVVLTNLETGDKIESKTDSNGELKLTSVLPGEYSIRVSKTLSKEEYKKIFGYEANGSDQITFNGNQEKVKVNANVNLTLITLQAGKIGDLLIKQIYYAGSDKNKGAVFRDQFIEIYNNSDQVIYADGLCFAQLDGNNNTKVVNHNVLPNGQFDWSKSQGNEFLGSAANTDYVYAKYIYRVPGTGKQYPIQPGESIVIAQTAINHKAPYDGADGKPVTIDNPELTVDLSHADFEVFLGTLYGSQYIYDIQNPAVPDMEYPFRAIKARDMILDPAGKDSYIIFRATTAEINQYPLIPEPGKPNGYKYARVSKSIIIDGVDTSIDAQGSSPKKLPTDIDAQFASVEKTYSSKSIIRKTKRRENERVILQDTNNSKEDFVVITANPKGFAN